MHSGDSDRLIGYAMLVPLVCRTHPKPIENPVARPIVHSEVPNTAAIFSSGKKLRVFQLLFLLLFCIFFTGEITGRSHGLRK
jgi:hypothetical protein